MDFVEEAFEEISEQERDKIKADVRVVSALRSKTPTVSTIKIGEENIEFRLAISKKLRRKLAFYKAKMEGKQSPDLDKMLYDIISSICTQDPWNKWQTWEVYDDEDENGVMEILFQMLKEINSHMEDVKNFRGKQGGSSPLGDM
jgi:hypothetical protein